MPTSIDSLQIDIIAQSNKADIAIDRLVSKLDKLSNSLGKIPVGSISSLASGVDKLGRAMQVMGSVDSRTFTRLANNINKLSQVNVASINTASSSIHRLSKSLNILGSTSSNAQGVVQLSSALGRLGGKSVSNAIVNIPLLATAMNDLMVTLSKAPFVSRNVIDLANALANLAHNGKRVGTASRSVTSGLHNTRKSMESTSRSATSLAATFGRLYANYFLLIRGAKGFINAIKGTSDYIEAFNYYNVTFGKIASEWDKDWEKYGYENAEAYADSFTERMQESLSKMSGLEVVIDADGKGLLTSTNLQNLGLNIREITQYASQLASVTNSVGQTGEVSLAAARSFTKLGADISSLFNIDYSDVMANLQSGLIGQSRALYKYGIDITNATLSTYAFELGLKKSVSEMTQAEKMQLRMIAILDQSKVAWGDLANTINSPSNMLRQFGNNLKEVGMVLGQLFLPLMERVMPVVNGATIAIKNFLINLASLLGVRIDFDAFGEGFTDLGEDADSLADGLDNVANSAKKVNAGLRKFDELNNINIGSGAGSSGGLGSSIDLTNEIIKASEEYEKAWNEAFKKMEARSAKFARKFEKYLKPITTIFEKLFKGDFAGAGAEVSNLVVGIREFFSRAIDNVDWNGIGEKIGDFLESIDWLKIIKSGIKLKFNIWKAIAEVWFGMFEASPVETSIITALAALKFTKLGGIVGASIASAITGTAFVTAILGAFASLGGIGGILAIDIATVVGAGTLAEIGMVVGAGIIGGIVSSVGGFHLGQWLNETITGEDINMSWAEQFESIKKSFSDGSWKDALNLWGSDIKAGLEAIFNDVSVFQTDLGIKFRQWLNEQESVFVKSGEKLGGWVSEQESLFVKFGQNLGNNFKEFVKGIIDELKELLDVIKDFKPDTGGAGFVPGALIPQFPKYANGGFPEDGFFYANKNELVGGFSNGKTAVANNEQITEGIANAVYPAVYNAMVSALSNNKSNTTVKIEGDSRGMFNVFVEEWKDEVRRTHTNPVPIYMK